MSAEEASLQKQLESFRRSKYVLEEQAAQYGGIAVPPYVVLGIEDLQKKIETAEQQLESLQNTHAPTSARNQRQEIRKLTAELDSAEQAEDWEKVIELGEKILELDANQHIITLSVRDTYFKQGNILLEQKSYKQAVQYFDDSIRLDTEFADGYLWRSVAYLQLKFNAQALKDFNQSVELNSGEPTIVYCKRGEIYLLQKQFDLAIADFSKSISLDSKYAEAYEKRGLTYLVKGGNTQAEQDFTRARDEFYERGQSLYGQKQYYLSVEIFSKALNLDPNYAWAYISRGASYHNVKEYEKAIADYNKALDLDPKYADAYYNRGNTYCILKEYEKAIADYNKAIELDPKYAMAYNGRGVAYKNLRENEKAIQDISKALELDPKFAAAYYNRGNLYQQIGNIEAARRDFQKAAELGDAEAKQKLAELG